MELSGSRLKYTRTTKLSVWWVSLLLTYAFGTGCFVSSLFFYFACVLVFCVWKLNLLWTPFLVYWLPDSILNFLGKEHALVICNHRSDIDWLVGWVLAQVIVLFGMTFFTSSMQEIYEIHCVCSSSLYII